MPISSSRDTVYVHAHVFVWKKAIRSASLSGLFLAHT